MAMDPIIATMRISEKLRAAETALDDALLTQSDLFSTMLTARRETHSAPFTGQNLLMRLAKSQQTLVTAGGDLARIHGGLLDLAQTEGFLEECPEGGPMKKTGQLKAA